jgi:putative membrane protein
MTTRSNNSLFRIIVIVVAVLLLVPLLMMFSFPMMGMMRWWGSAGPSIGLSPFWGIGMMLLFLLVLVGIGYFLYKSVTGEVLNEKDRALEELRITYARGDISQEEFQKRRDLLEEDS